MTARHGWTCLARANRAARNAHRSPSPRLASSSAGTTTLETGPETGPVAQPAVRREIRLHGTDEAALTSFSWGEITTRKPAATRSALRPVLRYLNAVAQKIARGNRGR